MQKSYTTNGENNLKQNIEQRQAALSQVLTHIINHKGEILRFKHVLYSAPQHVSDASL